MFKEIKDDKNQEYLGSDGQKQQKKSKQEEKERVSLISSPEQKQRHLLAKRTRVSLTKPSLKLSQEVKAPKSKFLSKRAQKLLNANK